MARRTKKLLRIVRIISGIAALLVPIAQLIKAIFW